MSGDKMYSDLSTVSQIPSYLNWNLFPWEDVVHLHYTCWLSQTQANLNNVLFQIPLCVQDTCTYSKSLRYFFYNMITVLLTAINSTAYYAWSITT